ncbi:MAG TPA: DUF6036 family nucleotidyltransferase [Phycisphaerales bacterium]|jgi:hypothetical protein|nr:DUF6036 family nucleotidyltransferase [Phycisphaerales bacterium]
MQRADLEHILRASSDITGATEFIVIGSQAILGQFPDAPPTLTVSREVDIYSTRSPNDAVEIDASIGQGSLFDDTHGYFAHGVGEETAILPAGWKDRLVRVQTPSTGRAVGWCLEVHDLAVSKLIAGREHDVEFVGELLRHGLADRAIVRQRLSGAPLDGERLLSCEARLDRIPG